MATNEPSSEVANLTDAFKARANNFEKRAGGSTRAIAKHVVSIVPQPPPDAVVLDNACGTGFVADELLKAFPDSNLHIHAVDVSEGMINILQGLIKHNKWEDKVETGVMAGQELKFPDHTFDLSITNFGIFFFPDPAAGAKEIYRTLKPKGTAVVTCWKHVGFVPIFYEVQKVVNPAKPLKLDTLEKWMEKDTIVQTMGQGGFKIVEIEQKDAFLVQDTWEDMIDILKGFFEDFARKQWTPEEFSKIDSATRQVIKEQSDKLCVMQDEKPALKMIAWEALAIKY